MNQVQNLQHIARELLYLGMDERLSIYTDHFRANCEHRSFSLVRSPFLLLKGATSEEEESSDLSVPVNGL